MIANGKSFTSESAPRLSAPILIAVLPTLLRSEARLVVVLLESDVLVVVVLVFEVDDPPPISPLD